MTLRVPHSIASFAIGWVLTAKRHPTSSLLSSVHETFADLLNGPHRPITHFTLPLPAFAPDSLPQPSLTNSCPTCSWPQSRWSACVDSWPRHTQHRASLKGTA